MDGISRISLKFANAITNFFMNTQKMKYIIMTLFLLSFLVNGTKAQTLTFAQLTGSPTMNTTGWNLTGAAATGDTGGDGDSNADELILTPNSDGSSGGAFFNQSIDLATCLQWTVDFYFRINDGDGADGLAFCFLDVPPTGFVSGGGVGIPASANGIKVVFDTYDNGCGANPEIQIYNGTGYNECATGIVKVNNTGGNLNFIRSNSYNHAVISYSNGTISVTVNNTLWLTTSYTVSFVGYMGFTASTGGSNDRHSIKNARIYADIAVSNAGPDISICNNGTGQIGVATNASYVYNWTPSTGLSSATISNPSVTLTNSGSSNSVQQYVVQTTLASNPSSCPVYDTVNVTVRPFTYSTINQNICHGGSYTLLGQTFTNTGTYQLTTTGVNGCDSIITLNLVENPLVPNVIDMTICQGSSYFFNNQTLTTTGVYQMPLQTPTGCDSLVVLNLTVAPPLTSTLNVQICPGDTYNFLGLPLSNAGTYSQTIQNANGCDSIVTLNLSFKPQPTSLINQSICQGQVYTILGQTYSNTGTYTLTTTAANGCDSTITLNLTVFPIPASPTITTNAPLTCPGDTLVLNAADVANGTFAWTGPSNFTSTQQNNGFTAYPQNIGNYNATVTVNGCTSPVATVFVDILNIFSFEDFDFPNVITPNGDGINDSLDIQGHYHTCFEFELFIYNRWGSLIFNHKFNQAPFAGKTNDGKDVEDGVYFYKLIYDGDKVKQGFLHVLH